MTNTTSLPVITRQSSIWAVVSLVDGQQATSRTYSTRREARELKNAYRANGVRAWVVRYSPQVDFGS